MSNPKDPESELKAPEILSAQVQKAVREYFVQLDGHSGGHLYELVLSQIEAPLFKTTLEHCAHNQSKASKILGISRGTLRKKMQTYGIE